jgi:tetratricopeptide (TPR) repeat protein
MWAKVARRNAAPEQARLRYDQFMSCSRAEARVSLLRSGLAALHVPVRANLLVLLLALWVPVGKVRALSEDDERARAHFVAGEAYFEDQRYADAAREFKEAYELSGRPEMLLNLSRAHERAGASADAMADLELLLARHPQTSYRAEAEVRLANLRAAYPELTTPQQASRPAEPRAAPQPAPERAARKLWPPRLPTLILGGAAAAGALLAVATGWAAHAEYGDLEQRCRDGCPDDIEADKERGQRLARTSTGMTFAAIALGGASAVLWVLDVRASGAREPAKHARAGAARDTRARLGLRSSAAALEARLRIDF